jgi:hypothetical protein
MLYRLTMFADEAAGERYTNATWPVVRLWAPAGTWISSTRVE